jgi:phospholipase C
MEKTHEIKHVVVLMLENRSFDHSLGLLNHPDRASAVSTRRSTTTTTH